MKTLYNPFGGRDEQAMINQYYDLHGRSKAENLDRIYNLHWHTKDWTVFAKREGFTEQEINDFKQIQF